MNPNQNNCILLILQRSFLLYPMTYSRGEIPSPRLVITLMDSSRHSCAFCEAHTTTRTT